MCVLGLEKALLELSNKAMSKISFWRVSWMPAVSVSPHNKPAMCASG